MSDRDVVNTMLMDLYVASRHKFGELMRYMAVTGRFGFVRARFFNDSKYSRATLKMWYDSYVSRLEDSSPKVLEIARNARKLGIPDA